MPSAVWTVILNTFIPKAINDSIVRQMASGGQLSSMLVLGVFFGPFQYFGLLVMRDEFIVHIHPLKAYYFWDKSILGWLRVSEWVSEEIWEKIWGLLLPDQQIWQLHSQSVRNSHLIGWKSKVKQTLKKSSIKLKPFCEQFGFCSSICWKRQVAWSKMLKAKR